MSVASRVRVWRVRRLTRPAATRFPVCSAGGLLWCSATRLSVCVCVVLRSPRARHERLVADILTKCHEDAKRKVASVEFKLYATAIAGTKLYWLMTEAAHECEQLAHCCYATARQPGLEPTLPYFVLCLC